MPVETTVMYKPSIADPGQEKCSQVIFGTLTYFYFWPLKAPPSILKK